MTRIVVLGGTGYAGSQVAAEAARRGLHVTAASRTPPETDTAGVIHRQGDVQDGATLNAVLADADVVVSALSPRGALAPPGTLRELLRSVTERAAAARVRVGIVGGAGSLQQHEGGPLVMDAADFPAAYRDEAAELAAVLADLRAADAGLDWFFVSPAGSFGARNPGRARGEWRTGADVLLTDAEGRSEISGADLAAAVVDEVEHPQHHRARFTVAY